MKIYLAGEFSPSDVHSTEGVETIPYLLQSFYHLSPRGCREDIMALADEFILDSGAYTFMEKKKSGANEDLNLDWEDYTDRYAEFINTYDIDRFFELDIDSVVGLARVRELRRRLEQQTGKPTIPVWHKSRGRDAFLRLCEQYDYIAIGGIVSGEITKADYKYLPWFIDQAHDHGTQIHGLGFTPTIDPGRYPFDSVDSTSWLYGGINNTVYKFTGTGIESMTKENHRRKHYLKFRRHNLREWVKYARYMDSRHSGPETTTETETNATTAASDG